MGTNNRRNHNKSMSKKEKKVKNKTNQNKSMSIMSSKKKEMRRIIMMKKKKLRRNKRKRKHNNIKSNMKSTSQSMIKISIIRLRNHNKKEQVNTKVRLQSKNIRRPSSTNKLRKKKIHIGNQR